MVWGGDDPHKLGTLPTAVLTMLEEGPDAIALLIIGSGGSHGPDGSSEADITKRLFLDRFGELDRFPAIRNHPDWSGGNREKILKIVQGAVTDVHTINTTEEIASAALVFAAHRITRVRHITGASHGPRCQQLQSSARESGIIPAGQHWELVVDDIPYPGTSAADTLVMEEPHRLDDPLQQVPDHLRPAQLFRKFYYVIPRDRRRDFLEDVSRLMESFLV